MSGCPAGSRFRSWRNVRAPTRCGASPAPSGDQSSLFGRLPGCGCRRQPRATACRRRVRCQKGGRMSRQGRARRVGVAAARRRVPRGWPRFAGTANVLHRKLAFRERARARAPPGGRASRTLPLFQMTSATRVPLASMRLPLAAAASMSAECRCQKGAWSGGCPASGARGWPRFAGTANLLHRKLAFRERARARTPPGGRASRTLPLLQMASATRVLLASMRLPAAAAFHGVPPSNSMSKKAGGLAGVPPAGGGAGPASRSEPLRRSPKVACRERARARTPPGAQLPAPQLLLPGTSGCRWQPLPNLEGGGALSLPTSPARSCRGLSGYRRSRRESADRRWSRASCRSRRRRSGAWCRAGSCPNASSAAASPPSRS